MTAADEPRASSSGIDIERLVADRAARRSMEWRAIVHVVRPLAADLLATFCFYAVFAVSDSVSVATILALGMGVAQLGWMLATGRKVPPIQWTSLLLVLIVGALSMATHDPRYMLYKASLIYIGVGATMLKPGWLGRYVPPVAVQYLSRARIVAFGFLWAALLVGTGVMNLVLTLTQPARTVVVVMAVWAPSTKIVLLVGQYLVGRAHVRRGIAAARCGNGLGSGAAVGQAADGHIR